MKKFLAILLIFAMTIPQTFAQIKFDSPHTEWISATRQSPDMAVTNIIRHAMIGA